MRAILDLKPSQLNIDSLLSQFQGLTGLSFPALDGLPSAEALRVPDFGTLTEMIGQFQSMAEKLAQGPDALLGELRQRLEDLGGGSLDVGGPLAAITGPLGSLGAVPTMLTTFVERGQALGGMLNQLGSQQVDGALLQQLFQPDILAETLRQHLPFTSLTDRLKDIDSLDGWLGALAEKPWLAGYQAVLAAITAIPAGGPVTASDLAVLEAAAVEPIPRGIQVLTKAMTDAVALLTTFNGSLGPLAHGLTSGLERVCDTLDPQKLGGSLTMFDQVTAALDGLNLGDIPAQLARAAQVVEDLVAQGLETVLAPLQTMVHTLESGLETAKQALVKVSAIITDVLAQLQTFVEKVASTVSSVVKQVEAGLHTFMETANGVLDKINGLLTQVFAFIRDVVQKIADFDFRPIIATFHAMLFKITALLDSPEARPVFEQVKASLDQVAQQVESIDLSPVFDQVLGEADRVKAALAALDLSQLNALLRQALKVALELVQSAIDPPSKVTDAVKATYADTVQAPLNTVVQPIKETFDTLLDIIRQCEPGTLVSKLITPPYEALVAELKAVIDPAQVVQHLGGLRELYDNILVEVDARVNPAKLLAPLLEHFNRMREFVQSLSPDVLLKPLEALWAEAQGQLARLDIPGQIATHVIGPVQGVIDVVTNFQLADHLPVQQIQDFQISTVVDTLQQALRAQITQLDLSGLEQLLSGLKPVLETIQRTLREQTVLTRVQALTTQATEHVATLMAEMTDLADLWQRANTHFNSLTIPPQLRDTYARQLHALNPIPLLAGATNLVDPLVQALKTARTTLQQTWQTLTSLLEQRGAHLTALLTAQAGALQAYLGQVLDSFVAGPLQAIVQRLEVPLAGIKQAITAVLGVPQHLAVLQQIPDGMQQITTKVGEVLQVVQEFNFDFLKQALANAATTIRAPLDNLDGLIQGFFKTLDAIYQRVLGTLQNLNPVHIIASARGEVTLNRSATAGDAAIPVPAGTVVTAIVHTLNNQPRPFTTLQAVTLEAGQAAVTVWVQAQTPGRGGEIVVPGAAPETEPETAAQAIAAPVAWEPVSVPLTAGSTVTLEPTHTVPILGLYTMCYDLILAKLATLHPDKLIAEPLNAQFEEIRRIIDSLGLDRLFDVLFSKFGHLETELFAGLNRSAVALGEVLRAVPV